MVEIEGIPYFLNPKYRDDFTREIDRHSVFCPGSKIRRSIILERLKYAPKKLKDLIWRIELHHVYGYWRLDFFNLRSDDSDYVWAELLQLFGGVFQNTTTSPASACVSRIGDVRRGSRSGWTGSRALRAVVAHHGALA